MIDYEVLCQTIEDWRAGRRPSLDLSATPAAAVEGYAEADQGYADDGGYEQQYAEPGYEGQHAEPGYEGQHAEPGYEGQYAEPGYEGQYAEPGYEGQYAEPGYEQVPEGGYEGYDEQGTPDAVAAGSTSPVDVDDLAYSEDEDDPHYG